MSEYARIVGGQFTVIRYTAEELKFGNTIAEILETGDEIYPIIEPLELTETGYREPTEQEINSSVRSVADLTKVLTEHNLGKDVASLDDDGDVCDEQLPEEEQFNVISRLLNVLMTPYLTAELLEEFSGTAFGMTAWEQLKSIPKQFLTPGLISVIRRCPTVYLSCHSNETIVSQLGGWDFDNMLSTDRAYDVAALDIDEFTFKLDNNCSESLLRELSESYDALEMIFNDQTKYNLILSRANVIRTLALGRQFIRCCENRDSLLWAVWGNTDIREDIWSIGTSAIEAWTEGPEYVSTWITNNVARVIRGHYNERAIVYYGKVMVLELRCDNDYEELSVELFKLYDSTGEYFTEKYPLKSSPYKINLRAIDLESLNPAYGYHYIKLIPVNG